MCARPGAGRERGVARGVADADLERRVPGVVADGPAAAIRLVS